MSSTASSLSMMRRGSANTDMVLTSVAKDLAVAVEEIGTRAGGGLVGGDFQRERRIAREAEQDQLGGDAEHSRRQAQHQKTDAAAALVEPRADEIAARALRSRCSSDGALFLGAAWSAAG